jgi:hypothetical protein
VKEVLKGIPRLKVVNESPDWNSGTHEHRSASEDLGIAMHYAGGSHRLFPPGQTESNSLVRRRPAPRQWLVLAPFRSRLGTFGLDGDAEMQPFRSRVQPSEIVMMDRSRGRIPWGIVTMDWCIVTIHQGIAAVDECVVRILEGIGAMDWCIVTMHRGIVAKERSTATISWAAKEGLKAQSLGCHRGPADRDLPIRRGVSLDLCLMSRSFAAPISRMISSILLFWRSGDRCSQQGRGERVTV